MVGLAAGVAEIRMSLCSKPLEMVDELKIALPLLRTEPRPPLGFKYRYGLRLDFLHDKDAGKKGRAVVATAALLKTFCELGNVM